MNAIVTVKTSLHGWRLLAILITILFSLNCRELLERPNAQQVNTPETLQATISALRQGPTTLVISVDIPEKHHAYLDSGKEGNLLPILFDWQPLISQNLITKEPSLKKSPAGEFYETAGAKVLRGNGTFLFETAGENLPEEGSLRVRSQICNEEIGQCYPPTFQTITFRQ